MPPLGVNSVSKEIALQRIVRMGGPVDDDMANLIVAQLLYLDSVSPTKNITMYVNSPGGSVTAGKPVSLCTSRNHQSTSVMARNEARLCA